MPRQVEALRFNEVDCIGGLTSTEARPLLTTPSLARCLPPPALPAACHPQPCPLPPPTPTRPTVLRLQMLARRLDLLPRAVRASVAFLRAWPLVEVVTALDTTGLTGGVVVRAGRLVPRAAGRDVWQAALAMSSAPQQVPARCRH